MGYNKALGRHDSGHLLQYVVRADHRPMVTS